VLPRELFGDVAPDALDEFAELLVERLAARLSAPNSEAAKLLNSTEAGPNLVVRDSGFLLRPAPDECPMSGWEEPLVREPALRLQRDHGQALLRSLRLVRGTLPITITTSKLLRRSGGLLRRRIPASSTGRTFITLSAASSE
jgi:hypothetical protein